MVDARAAAAGTANAGAEGMCTRQGRHIRNHGRGGRLTMRGVHPTSSKASTGTSASACSSARRYSTSPRRAAAQTERSMTTVYCTRLAARAGPPTSGGPVGEPRLCNDRSQSLHYGLYSKNEPRARGTCSPPAPTGAGAEAGARPRRESRAARCGGRWRHRPGPPHSAHSQHEVSQASAHTRTQPAQPGSPQPGACVGRARAQRTASRLGAPARPRVQPPSLHT